MKYSGYNILEQGLIIGSITARMEEKGELNSYDFESNYYTAAKQIIAEYEKEQGFRILQRVCRATDKRDASG